MPAAKRVRTPSAKKAAAEKPAKKAMTPATLKRQSTLAQVVHKEEVKLRPVSRTKKASAKKAAPKKASTKKKAAPKEKAAPKKKAST